MDHLTDQQRQDAIAACDRIQELARQHDIAIRNIARIFENLAAGRPADTNLEKI